MSRRLAFATLALAAGAAWAWAQAPAPAPTAPADPTKRQVPAEIVPPGTAPMPPPAEIPADSSAPAVPISPGSAAPVARPVPPLRELLDALPEPELDSLLRTLQQRYVAPEALDGLAMKRATLQGLLERLGTGATLFPEAPADLAPVPLHAEIVPPNGAAFLRLGTLRAETLPALDAALDRFTAEKRTALILDLRATPAGMSFELAAEVCQRFCPKGQPLFTVKSRGAQPGQLFTAKGEPRQFAILLVLTDSDTAGTAELIAATLRSLAKAIVIGQPTRGQAAHYESETLPSGRVLRFAVAEAQLPNDVKLVPDGVTPDIPVAMPQEETDKVLQEEQAKGLAPLLVELDRPRLNEAALVAGKNPEIDALIAAQKQRSQPAPTPLRDVTLQRALDLVTTLKALK